MWKNSEGRAGSVALEGDLAPTLVPGDKFLRLRNVCDLTARGRTWITDRVRRKEFPQPVRLGCSVVWLQSQVTRWMAEQIERSLSDSIEHLAITEASNREPV